MSTEGTNDAPEPGRPGVSEGMLRSQLWAGDGEDLFFDSNAPLPRALSAAGIGCWRIDLREQQVTFNAQDARIFGLEPVGRELSIEEFAALIYPQDLPIVAQQYWNAGRDREEFGAEFRIVRADGEIRWLEALGGFLRDATGTPRCVLGVHVDITERKLTEQKLERLDARRLLSVEAADVGDWEYDIVRGEAFWSRKACEQMGLDPAIQPTFEEGLATIHPDDRSEVDEAVDRAIDPLVSDDAYQTEFRLVHPDGEIVWVESRGRAMFDTAYRGRHPTHLLGAMVDVTERKAAEEELREAHRRKNKFLAMLGHELRNPLMAINSAAELLEQFDLAPPLVSRAQRIIARQSDQMSRLIDGLLDVSRITRGKLQLDFTLVDVVEVLRHLIEDRQKQLSSRRVEISVEPGADQMFTQADMVRISQVFDNLVVNAIKFTDESDTIRVSVCREHGQAVVSVEDTGAGIDPEFLPHIFEPFQQAPQYMARSRGGLGLGLALAKELVDLHGGTIDAHSEGVGRGSEFTVRLPLLDTEDVSSAADTPASTGAPKILLIEDNPDIAELLTLQLETAGCEVQVTFRASQGLDLLDEFKPDIVVCDLGLPEISGYAFAETVREELGLQELPLVALTGYGDPETHRRTLESGFDAHIIKPVEVDRLLDIFEELRSPGSDQPSSRSH